ncbi:MAG: photosystem II protein Psb27 [Cyanobacteria bacterium J06648_11]
MKRWFSKLVALVLIAVMFVSGCATTPGTELLSGNYANDVQTVVETLRATADMPADADGFLAARAQATSLIDAFSSRYPANSYNNKQSYTTLRTVFNTLGSYYRGEGTRSPNAKKLERVRGELERVEKAISVGR